MINIPLSFSAMWLIMLLGVLTHILAKINKINHETPGRISLKNVVYSFFEKEWASYGMSIIITAIVSYSFYYMKRFDHSSNAEITYWARWVPAAVIVLYLFGVLNQWVFYWILGRIEKKGGVNIDLLNNQKT
jgi:membrane-bound metal-dependent hydrolase YbcI (DUF457 family)